MRYEKSGGGESMASRSAGAAAAYTTTLPFPYGFLPTKVTRKSFTGPMKSRNARRPSAMWNGIGWVTSRRMRECASSSVTSRNVPDSCSRRATSEKVEASINGAPGAIFDAPPVNNRTTRALASSAGSSYTMARGGGTDRKVRFAAPAERHNRATPNRRIPDFIVLYCSWSPARGPTTRSSSS